MDKRYGERAIERGEGRTMGRENGAAFLKGTFIYYNIHLIRGGG